MVSKRFKVAFGVATAAFVGPVAASQAETPPKVVAGWTIERGNYSCTMEKSQEGRGRLRIPLGLRPDGNADSQVRVIHLHINHLLLDDRKPVDLTYAVGPKRFTVRAVPDTNGPFHGRFGSDASPQLAEALATLPSLVAFGPDGKYLFAVSLGGYGQAMTALKSCIDDVSADELYGE